MRSVARAEPSSEVAGLADGDATQVRADADHDKPLGLLGALGVLLRVTQRLDVDSVGLSNLVGGPVANEDGLSAPL